MVKLYRNDSGKNTSKIVEKLGSIEDLKAKSGDRDPIEQVKNYVKELLYQEKKKNCKIFVKFSQRQFVKKNEQQCYKGVILFLQKVYHDLEFRKICEKISRKYKIRDDLNELLSILLQTRIIYSGFKLSSVEDAHRFIERPKTDIHQVYRALTN